MRSKSQRSFATKKAVCARAEVLKRALIAVSLVALAGLLARGDDDNGAIAAATLRSRLTFNDLQLTNCYYRNQFFGKDVRAAFALFDSTGSTQIDPPSGNPPYLIGRYARYGATPSDVGIQPGHTGPGIVKANCDGTIYNIPVADTSQLPALNLAMGNHPPTSNGITAFFNGVSVRGVAPGSTVFLRVSASDADSNPLTFLWAANEGRIKNSGGRVTGWRLPLSRGLHFAYVLIGDGRGGYHEDSIGISTDADVVPAAVSSPATSTKASDFIRASDHFLTYYSTLLNYNSGGADTKRGSCLYYQAIGVVNNCAADGTMIGQLFDFDTWRAKWGFGGGTRAVYANVADLNLQRDMHGITNANGTAFYVCNSPNTPDFPNVSGAIRHKGVVACVAMEYSPPPGGGAPFTKFITFGPSGKLLQSVNLDGQGEKYMPGSCVICHGSGNYIGGKGRIDQNPPINPPDGPDLKAHFLPFDLDNFAFSTNPNFTRTIEEPALRTLNQLVLNTNPTPAIAELINGWYPTAGSTFNGNFIPPTWDTAPTADRDFYRGVIKPACRMCHAANNVPFNQLNGTTGSATSMAGRVCGNTSFASERFRYVMPNARVTFDRFWNDEGGIGGATQAQRMLNFINSHAPPGVSLAKCVPPLY